jgi:proline dehydrogenase
MAADIYHRLLDEIAESQKINANISVKLTQMGLELSPDLAYTRLPPGLTEHARVYRQLCAHRYGRLAPDPGDAGPGAASACAREGYRGHIGIVIQAYLFRSEADIQQLIANGIRVRLCKGAYQEPPSVAFAKKTDTDTNYVRLSGILLSSPIYHGLATHDEAMIEAAKNYAT